MKTIDQMCAEAAKSLPAGEDGRVNASDATRLKLETYFRFWTDWLVILDPFDARGSWRYTAMEIFGKTAFPLRSEPERLEIIRLLKNKLGVPRLSFSTFFKLREILADACQMAKDYRDVDVALCALIVFVQLELGAEPDPEYGDFPQPESPTYELRDGDLSDDPIVAEIELEVRHDTFEDFGTSEYHSLRWFQKWEEILSDRVPFEEAFPRMGHRQANVARAIKPVLEHLDPVGDGYVLELFLRWAKRLLDSPLEEHRPHSGPETMATKAA